MFDLKLLQIFLIAVLHQWAHEAYFLNLDSLLIKLQQHKEDLCLKIHRQLDQLRLELRLDPVHLLERIKTQAQLK